MYTILVNDSNALTTTIKERIMQRSKLVDKLHFLVDPIYKEHDMTKFTAVMEYISPVSRELRTELLTKSEALYKGMIEYTLPFDTLLTKEAGNIEVQLTFTYVELDAVGNSYQYVRKTTPTTITILAVPAWCNIVADDALSAMDQRLIQMDAMVNALNDMTQILSDTKADNIKYDEDTSELQLLSGKNEIGDKVTIKTGKAELEDGVPVVDFSVASEVPPEEDDDSNVVEF